MKRIKLKWKDYIVIVIITAVTYGFSLLILKTGFLLGGITSINSPNDSRFSDYYARVIRSGDEEKQSHSIVIVSLQDCQERKTIARLVDVLDSLQPQVIGFDVLLEGQTDGDSALTTSLLNGKNIVLARRVLENGLVSYPIYDDLQEMNFGIVNFEGQTLFDKIRHFKTVFQFPNNGSYNSFASAIVKQSDIVKYERLIERGNEKEIINYHRFIKFPCIKWDEIINKDGQCILDSVQKICDKIVLIGLEDDSPSKPSSINEDVHITPVNEVWTGTKIQAASVDTILKEDYVNSASVLLVHCVSLLLLFMWIWYLYISQRRINSFRLLMNRIIQVLLILMVFLFGILCYSKNRYFDFSIITIGMGISAICFDVTYSIYSMIINNKNRSSLS